MNGGTAVEVPGTWSASVEWLVRRLTWVPRALASRRSGALVALPAAKSHGEFVFGELDDFCE